MSFLWHAMDDFYNAITSKVYLTRAHLSLSPRKHHAVLIRVYAQAALPDAACSSPQEYM